MKKNRKQKSAETQAKPDSSPTPKGLPSPKRGAFPTPKEDLAKAKPYIPDSTNASGPQPKKSNNPGKSDSNGS
jgi:hypothetical protein